MRLGDHGADFYAISLLTSRRWAAANPAAVTGLIRALVRAQYETLAAPDAAVQVLRGREPLIDEPLETARLRMALDELTFTAHTRQPGFGQIDTGRLQRGVDMVRDALNIDRAMLWSEVHDPP